MPTADLEIGLHRWDAGRFAVELQFRRPDDEAEIAPIRGLASIDPAVLRAEVEESYGQALSRALFADPVVSQGFSKIRSVAEAIDVRLRVRLFIGPSAPELHALRWELLRDPQTGKSLLTDEAILFSRFLSSLDWRMVKLRPEDELQALVVVANPSDLSAYRPDGRALPPIDVAGEVGRATAALDGIPVTPLTGPGTLERLIDHLRDEYDIVYLVCHGALIEGDPRLWLEDESGKSAKVSGTDLVTRLGDLERRPRLIVLASCQSAGAGEDARADDGGVLAALGPRLAEAGIPAVIAMQGNITMRTVAVLMPVFFKELRRDGQIDRAMAAARGAVRDRDDQWMPVLFMRLGSGRIWYVPGFLKGSADEFEGWPALLSHIEQGECTPILGSGLLESLIGSVRDIARRWAESNRFPMAPHEREEMPQVAQYLSVIHDYSFLWDTLKKGITEEVLDRYRDALAAEVRGRPMEEVLAAAAAVRRARNPAEPHRVLAMLPLPLYLTTNPDNLLGVALAEADAGPGKKKAPRIELCRWNEETEWPPSVFDRGAAVTDYRPSAAEPLVYHLFGQLRTPDSLVLTEDNYFDFLIGTTRDNDLIPPVVRRMLTKTSLMFLGFRMDEWDFRVLFRSIMSREGSQLRRRYSHVAVQLDPEEGRNLDPERARRYLQHYFQDARINIYWGNVEDFTRELLEQWTQTHPQPQPQR